jgi:hypothetical protein
VQILTRFSSADGSLYEGDWVGGLKNGIGRWTGNEKDWSGETSVVYVGPHVNCRLTSSVRPHILVA